MTSLLPGILINGHVALLELTLPFGLGGIGLGVRREFWLWGSWMSHDDLLGDHIGFDCGPLFSYLRRVSS